MKILLLTILLISCGRHEAKSPQSVDTDYFAAKDDIYSAESMQLIYEKGFVHAPGDDLLFRCLGVYSGLALDYSAHESGAEPGRLFRWTDHEIYDKGLTASDFSKDMMKGFMFCVLAKKDIAILDRVILYLENHAYFSGRGDITRTYITPSLMDQIRRVRRFLNGNRDENTPTSFLLDDTENSEDGIFIRSGFEAHLQVIDALLEGIINRSISQVSLSVLKAQANRQPRNALFQAVLHLFTTGDQTIAQNILKDETLFPKDRLPTARDRSEDYLWQRDDEPKDWSSEDIDKQHFGIDYLFVRKIIKGIL